MVLLLRVEARLMDLLPTLQEVRSHRRPIVNREEVLVLALVVLAEVLLVLEEAQDHLDLQAHQGIHQVAVEGNSSNF